MKIKHGRLKYSPGNVSLCFFSFWLSVYTPIRNDEVLKPVAA